mmetsp:Transcript_16025/g.28782  ORF Transcript_16025/g.28782 Transcript_16025/m.28782 type:complete len:82 (+) Transcript_16025:97-342(+)
MPPRLSALAKGTLIEEEEEEESGNKDEDEDLEDPGNPSYPSLSTGLSNGMDPIKESGSRDSTAEDDSLPWSVSSRKRRGEV